MTSNQGRSKRRRRRRGNHDTSRREVVTVESLEERILLATDVGGAISEDTTWSGTVRVTNDLTINENVTLNIEPGTVVKSNIGVLVLALGTIDATATAVDPIIFTSIQDDSVGEDLTPDAEGVPAPGQWDAIRVESSSSEFDFVQVRYAGNRSNPGNNSWRTSALHVRGDASPKIQNTQVLDAENYGIHVVSGGPSLANVHVERAGSGAMFVELEATPKLTNVTATDNVANQITLNTANKTLTANQTWDFGTLPVHFTNDLRIGEGVEVTVAPGSIFKLPYGAQLEVDGSLQAIGTLTEPIIFTATSDDAIGGDTNSDAEEIDVVPGSWNAIWLDSSDSVLDHVQIRYAGNQSNPGNTSWRTSALHVRNDASPTIRNTQVVDAENYGIHLVSGAPTLEAVLVERAGSGAMFVELEATPKLTNVTATDNAANQITLNTANKTLTANQTWDFGSLPVHFTNDLRIGEGVEVTIAPGSIFKLPYGAKLEVDGSLQAIGTLTEPIIFTATSDDAIGGDTNSDAEEIDVVPGNWNAIWLDSSDSVLDHVQIRYAGNQSNPGNNSSATRPPCMSVMTPLLRFATRKSSMPRTTRSTLAPRARHLGSRSRCTRRRCRRVFRVGSRTGTRRLYGYRQRSESRHPKHSRQDTCRRQALGLW